MTPFSTRKATSPGCRFRWIGPALGYLAVGLSLGVVPSVVPAADKQPAQIIQFQSARFTTADLAGHLRRPDGTGPFPAVVLLHGCGGDWRGMDSRWGTRLVKWGYVALSVDSFASRGIKGTCFGDADPPDHVFDAYGALDFLAAQKFVAADRIAVLGGSLGATMALRGVEQGFVEQAARRRFQAAIALYPECAGITGMMTVPTLILIGQLDDLTSAKNCQDLKSGNPLEASRSSPEDRNIHLTVLPGAYHAFDNTSFLHGEWWHGHWLAYNAEATTRAAKKVRAFLHDALGD
jgi:dienelactone hydrolase